MSRYLARLAKLEAAIPPPAMPQGERPPLDFADIVAKAKAEAAFLEIANPLQRVIFHRDKIERLERRRTESSQPTDRPLLEQFRKVQRIWIPSFLEDAQAEVRQAELDLIREAGFSSLEQPGAREHLAIELFAA